MGPLVSVVTPTWQRHDLLLGRCIPSVQAQLYPSIEHVVVSDGGDPELFDLIGTVQTTPGCGLIFDQLGNDRRGGMWGSVPRLRALELASGDLIAYLDDDDAFRKDHIHTLAEALEEHPEAGFAYAQMESHGPGGDSVIGGQEVRPCAIGTPMIMHRRELLEISTWGPPDSMEDWRLVDRWMERGIKAHFVEQVTVDVWPSAYWPGR